MSTIFDRYKEIASFYDHLYGEKENVWEEEAGRGPEFVRYMASLVENYGPERYLDVGCGEGFLLDAVSAPEKFGIEISREAIKTASDRTTASLCQGYVEELPYLGNCFDVVTAVGVLTHLLNHVSAAKEIHRVLRVGGLFIVMTYWKIPMKERILKKVSDFLYPKFRPVSLILWTMRKFSKRIDTPAVVEDSKDRVVQPVRLVFTDRSLRKLFKSAGFQIVHVITTRNSPDAPLQGSTFPIFIARKRGT